jgi:hypothetical protein
MMRSFIFLLLLSTALLNGMDNNRHHHLMEELFFDNSPSAELTGNSPIATALLARQTNKRELAQKTAQKLASEAVALIDEIKKTIDDKKTGEMAEFGQAKMDTLIEAEIANAKKRLINLERINSQCNQVSLGADNLKEPHIKNTVDKICLEMDLQVAQMALLLNQFVRWTNE